MADWIEVDLTDCIPVYDTQYIDGAMVDTGTDFWVRVQVVLPASVTLDPLTMYEFQVDTIDRMAPATYVNGAVSTPGVDLYSLPPSGDHDSGDWWWLGAEELAEGSAVLPAQIAVGVGIGEWGSAVHAGENRVVIEGSRCTVVGVRYRATGPAQFAEPPADGTVVGGDWRHQVYSGAVQAELGVGRSSAPTPIDPLTADGPSNGTILTKTAWWSFRAPVSGRVRVHSTAYQPDGVSQQSRCYLYVGYSQITSAYESFWVDVKAGVDYLVCALVPNDMPAGSYIIMRVGEISSLPVGPTWDNAVEIYDYSVTPAYDTIKDPRIGALPDDRALLMWLGEDVSELVDAVWIDVGAQLNAAVISPGSPIAASPRQVVWSGGPGGGFWNYDWSLQRVADDRYLAMFQTSNYDRAERDWINLLLMQVDGETVTVLDHVELERAGLDPQGYGWDEEEAALSSYRDGKALLLAAYTTPASSVFANNTRQVNWASQGYSVYVVDCASGSIVVGPPSDVPNYVWPGWVSSTPWYLEPNDIKVGSDGHGAIITTEAELWGFTVTDNSVTFAPAPVYMTDAYEWPRGLWGMDAVYFDDPTGSILMAVEDEIHENQTAGRFQRDGDTWRMVERAPLVDWEWNPGYSNSGARWLHPYADRDGKVAVFAGLYPTGGNPGGVFYSDVFGTITRSVMPDIWTPGHRWYDWWVTGADVVATDSGSGYYGAMQGEYLQGVGPEDAWQRLAVAFFGYGKMRGGPASSRRAFSEG